jgi:type I restriction enzyme, S subunit
MADQKQTVKFGDICREVKLSSKDPLAEGYDKYIGLEHLDSGSLKIKRWGSIAEDNPSFTRVFKKGQILFGRRRAYLKKAAIAEFDGICSGDIIVMEPHKDSNYRSLLPYVIHSDLFWDWAIKNSAGGLSPRTKFKSLAEFTFNRMTATQLEGLSKAFDLLKTTFEHSDMTKSALKNFGDVLVDCFTRFGINGEELRDSKVGKKPASWRVEEFQKIFEVDTRNGLYKSQDHYGKGPKMVHMGEMFKSRIIVESDVESSVDVSIKELDSFGLKKDDLLFARRSLTKEGAGLCCIYKGNDNAATFESSIIRVRLNKELANSDYFNYFFRSKYGRWVMERIIQTVAASGITGTELKKMNVPVPSITEQNHIVKLLNQYVEVDDVIGKNSIDRKKLQASLIGKLLTV